MVCLSGIDRIGITPCTPPRGTKIESDQGHTHAHIELNQEDTSTLYDRLIVPDFSGSFRLDFNQIFELFPELERYYYIGTIWENIKNLGPTVKQRKYQKYAWTKLKSYLTFRDLNAYKNKPSKIKHPRDIVGQKLSIKGQEFKVFEVSEIIREYTPTYFEINFINC